MEKESILINNELVKSGKNFLGILNDIKRRPEDASRELQIPIEEIHAMIEGKKPLSQELIKMAKFLF